MTYANIKKTSKTKLPIFAGISGIGLAALASQAHAQSADALIDKLVDKGILTANEAKDLRNDSDKDFNTAFAVKTGMPDWVTGYSFNGSFRGRYEQFSSDYNTGGNSLDKSRLRYRLLLGATVNMKDNLEVGFRIGSGDQKATGIGNPLSQNSTMTGNWSDKGIFIDLAYGKWTPISGGAWTLSTMFGKVERDVVFGDTTWMVIDPDLTPEGGVIQGSYAINNNHSINFSGGGFVLDANPSNSTHQPTMGAIQAAWKAKWNEKWNSSLGLAVFGIVNPEQLTSANVTEINQGNTRNLTTGAPIYNFTPVVGDLSVTYTLDSFPLYEGAFPITLKTEFMNNPGAPNNNDGYWAGITFGKSGKKHTWDLSYRYEYLEADAWYDQLGDDDNLAFYKSSPGGLGSNGYVGGTNIKGHFVKFNYSLTDSLTFSTTCYLNSLINPVVNGTLEPQSTAMHFFADIMWKF